MNGVNCQESASTTVARAQAGLPRKSGGKMPRPISVALSSPQRPMKIQRRNSAATTGVTMLGRNISRFSVRTPKVRRYSPYATSRPRQNSSPTAASTISTVRFSVSQNRSSASSAA